MIHNCYQPANPLGDPQGTSEHELWHKMEAASITADEVVSRYCKMVYDQAGSYERAAQVLGLDRRTVRAKILSIP